MSCDNQSVVYDPAAGYSPSCRIESVEVKEKNLRICAAVYHGDTRTLTRELIFDLDKEELIFNDSSCVGRLVCSLFLLNPLTRVVQDGDRCQLHCQDQRLDMTSSAPVEVRQGKISYGRECLDETALMSLQSVCHSIRTRLNCGLKSKDLGSSYFRRLVG